MATTKSVPEGVQAVFPMLVCQNPEAEAAFCAAAFGAIEQVRRPGPDGRPRHIAIRINEAFVVLQGEVPDATASRAPNDDGSSPVILFVYVADGLHFEPEGRLARRPCEGVWVSGDPANCAEGVAPTWEEGSHAARTRGLTGDIGDPAAAA
jgi:hypothetical protein